MLLVGMEKVVNVVLLLLNLVALQLSVARNRINIQYRYAEEYSKIDEYITYYRHCQCLLMEQFA